MRGYIRLALLIAVMHLVMVTANATIGISDTILLVNKEHHVDPGCSPTETINLCDYIPSYKNNLPMQKEAGEKFVEMYNAMKNDGIKNLKIISGYRSYYTQQTLSLDKTKLYRNQGFDYNTAYNKAAVIVAPPGTSEHQTGLAIDVSTNSSLTESFAYTGAGKWLRSNSYKYGFILRYDHTKTDITKFIYEPWHFRYVGIPHAQIMYEKGWCLEEYIEYLKNINYIQHRLDNGYLYEIARQTSVPDCTEEIIGVSSDNTGAYIITKYLKFDPMRYVYGHWSEGSVKYMIENNYASFDDYVFPDKPISRAEFVNLLYFIDKEAQKHYNGFIDVPEDYIYAKQIKSAYEKGIISGSGSCFYPDRHITRQEASHILSSLLNKKEIVYIEFSDTAKISSWAFQDVQKLAAADIINGYSDNTFRPNTEILWSEAIQMIYKIVSVQDV